MVELSLRASRLDGEVDVKEAVQREEAPEVGSIVKVWYIAGR